MKKFEYFENMITTTRPYNNNNDDDNFDAATVHDSVRRRWGHKKNLAKSAVAKATLVALARHKMAIATATVARAMAPLSTVIVA